MPSPLRNAQFRWMLSSNACFFMALHGQVVVRGWIVLEMTGSNLALGKVATAVGVSMILMAPLGGVIADRVERRRLVLIGQTSVFATELALLGLLWSGQLAFWHLVAGTVVMGLAFPMIMPARQAIVANLVGQEGLTAAVAVNQGAINAARMLGPMLAGGLISALGTVGAYAVGAGFYGLAALCLFGVARLKAPQARTLPVTEDIAEGWRFLRSDPLILRLLAFGMVPLFLAMPTQQLFVTFAKDVWRAGAGGLGLLQGMAGVGGVVGALFVLRRRSQRRLRLMLGCGLGFALMLALFSQSPRFGTALALVFVGYAAAAVFTTLNSAAIQVLIPDRVRGRVSSFMLVSFSLPLLGTLPIGALADAHGAPSAIAGASGVAALAILGFVSLSRLLRGLDARVLRATGPPTPENAENVSSEGVPTPR